MIDAPRNYSGTYEFPLLRLLFLSFIHVMSFMVFLMHSAIIPTYPEIIVGYMCLVYLESLTIITAQLRYHFGAQQIFPKFLQSMREFSLYYIIDINLLFRLKIKHVAWKTRESLFTFLDWKTKLKNIILFQVSSVSEWILSMIWESKRHCVLGYISNIIKFFICFQQYSHIRFSWSTGNFNDYIRANHIYYLNNKLKSYWKRAIAILPKSFWLINGQ